AAASTALTGYAAQYSPEDTATVGVEDAETLAAEAVIYAGDVLAGAVHVPVCFGFTQSYPASHGGSVPGIPALVDTVIIPANHPHCLNSLILDGIVAGVGAVLGFVPQMLVLFLLLAILESCGYMARIAFVLDRIFRKFGLSGKSFIP